ncbi:MAG: leucine-rich repeat protein [Candidatus Izimaplasma sp.]|nr:leucine-rich repeat protein [Candidatus Izimaplasma bacterium]
MKKKAFIVILVIMTFLMGSCVYGKEYVMSFNSMGGSELNDISFEHEEKLTNLPVPDKDGYILERWYLDENLEEPLNFNKMPDENLTLYANWINYTGIDYAILNNEVIITNYYGYKKDIQIPMWIENYPVTTIGVGAFYFNDLTSVTIPDSIKTIGEFSFAGNSLTSFTIPDGVIVIDEAAFYSNNLTNISIQESVTTIGHSAFFNNQLNSIIIPEAVITINEAAFAENDLTNITIIGDEMRFNDKWDFIGFPEELKPV